MGVYATILCKFPLTRRMISSYTQQFSFQFHTMLDQMKRSLFPAIAALLVVGGTVHAQATDHLLQRADDVLRLLNGQGEPEELFTPTFLAKVPAPQLRALSAQLVSILGICNHIELVERRNDFAGRFEISCDKGMKAPVTLAIEPSEPYRISGLLIGQPIPSGADNDDIGSLFDSLDALPGHVSVALMRLPDGAMIAARHPERSLAIGSAFKLYILGEMMAEVEKKERKWSDVVVTDSALFTPGGTLSKWPHGSPVTLHTLATLMISESDNSATDHLLRALGREKVERRMVQMGNSTPARNIPFLGTKEAFRLKTDRASDLRRRFISGSEKERRAVVAALDTSYHLDDFSGEGPAAIDTVEWYASAADLCHAMDWLRTAKDPGGKGRQIMAINPGLSFDPTKWRYIGYKGGSEPGVLDMTFLLQSADGQWYAFSAGWNDPTAPLDENRFFGLVQRVLNIGPWK